MHSVPELKSMASCAWRVRGTAALKRQQLTCTLLLRRLLTTSTDERSSDVAAPDRSTPRLLSSLTGTVDALPPASKGPLKWYSCGE
jgi:hypothetical protein